MTDLRQERLERFVEEHRALLERLKNIDFAALEQHVLAAAARKQDVHKLSYALAFDVPLDDVTPEQRKLGKALNMALIYTFNSNMPHRADQVKRLLDGHLTITGREPSKPELQNVPIPRRRS